MRSNKFLFVFQKCIIWVTSEQWRNYIEAKEAVLGGPRTQGAPTIYKKIKRWRKLKNNGTISKKKGYGAVGASQSQSLGA